jgi:cell division protein FtsX
MNRANSVRLAAAKKNVAIIEVVKKLNLVGRSNNSIAREFNVHGQRSARGGKFTAATISRLLEQAVVLEKNKNGK